MKKKRNSLHFFIHFKNYPLRNNMKVYRKKENDKQEGNEIKMIQFTGYIVM